MLIEILDESKVLGSYTDKLEANRYLIRTVSCSNERHYLTRAKSDVFSRVKIVSIALAAATNKKAVADTEQMKMASFLQQTLFTQHVKSA